MKTPSLTLASLLACALPLPFVSAQEGAIFIQANAESAVPLIHQPVETQPPLPPELENEFLTLLAATEPETAGGPIPTRGAREFSIKIAPPEEGQTEAAVHIHRNGEEIVRRVNVGNARKVLIGGGQMINERLPGPHGLAIAGIPALPTAPATPPVPTTWLGVATDEAPEEVRAQLPALAPGTGVLVRSVVPDSPASKAGLQRYDILAKLDDQLLVNPSQLRALVSGRKEHDTIKLTLVRNGKDQVLEVKLGIRLGGDDPWSVASFVTHAPGVAGAYMDPFVFQSRALVVDSKGNVITATTDGSPAPVELERVQEALKKAGVGAEVIKSVEKNLVDVRKQLEKSKTELERNKSETLKRLEESAEDLAKALESARAAAEKARKEAAERVHDDAGKPPVQEIKP
ncbi:PDZ domain-containing protein [Verrucomicrobium sp. BvORR106]|uniref:PDZ domain-containing protein n=1 Tax=Verrucomicrobium sp. BvORR106 TaxID=1403819 RepID=UPI00056DB08F|nr:PDZ domain-containing protein [Verrucomicrobium sp. BvORR106]